ncbi:PepSY domain-containing protein [Diaphorobacter sp. HDW4A]|uniref:PepSY-associated TM helix domain-containing protein n=1 Tax=Betaproteobacteria TaxID=28216 RepID=UPI00140987CE|nr:MULTISPECIES: PepSY-associated TM helix domain-containing protein [Betaproteobacteria]MCK6394940.1 PepSY domain-containing protein [Zoogloea sp.]QIL78939.1 PepSY domain-containing protein [Diaphorobacter sp. HDW4A]
MTIGRIGVARLRWGIDRPLLVLVHRWVGLVMAGFLLVAGLTGALLAWNEELEAAISPQLFRVMPPAPDAAPMDPLVLRERVQAAYPQALVAYAPLAVEPGHALVLRVFALPDPATGIAPDLPNNQVFVDPYTGRVLGERNWGDISQGFKNLMPFIYRLHYQLALGVVGSYAFGVIALLWTLDCFVGAYLTFPAPVRKGPKSNSAAKTGGKPWLTRWWPSWRVRWTGGSYKVNFDLHRAGGLWMWAMLFVLAWSSVAFNLSEVYDPVMRAVFRHQPDGGTLQALPAPKIDPAIGWHKARELGRRLMAEQARVQGFTIQREDALMHDPRSGLYRYNVISSRDVSHRWGGSSVVFDADTGALKSLWLPTGVASGDTIRTWLTSLHMAAVGGVVAGLPMKLFICTMGLVVAMLSVTGVIIWWKKRQGRARLAARDLADRPADGAGLPKKAATQDRAA